MLQDVPCEYVCDRIVGRQDVKWAQDLIEEGYLTEWIFDNLPGATSFVTVDKQRKYYSAGFKLGYKDYDVGTGQPIYYLNNHYTMVIRWRKAPGRAGDKDEKVIVGFEVYPRSINAGQRNITGCPADVFDDHEPLALSISPNETYTKYPDSSYTPKDQIDQNDGATMTIPYTYSVYFREDNDIEWANRWDHYFSDQAEGSFTHWLAIVNSLIISGILGVVCIVIWTRTSQDIKMKGDGLLEEAKLKRGEGGTGLEKPELSDDEDEILDDNSGWKLLHGDVFRSPRFGGILAPLIGSGSQLIFMFSGILLLSCFGILNPSWRGGFISVGIGLFVFAGLFSGYFSARVYKTFGGQNWRKNTLVVSDSILWMDNTDCLDCDVVSWITLHLLVCTQPFHMGSSIIYSYTIFNIDCYCLPLVTYTSTFGSCWFLLWLLSMQHFRTSNSNQYDTKTNSSKLVQQKSTPSGCCCWFNTFCCSLHRIVVCIQIIVFG